MLFGRLPRTAALRVGQGTTRGFGETGCGQGGGPEERNGRVRMRHGGESLVPSLHDLVGSTGREEFLRAAAHVNAKARIHGHSPEERERDPHGAKGEVNRHRCQERAHHQIQTSSEREHAGLFGQFAAAGRVSQLRAQASFTATSSRARTPVSEVTGRQQRALNPVRPGREQR